MKKINKNIFYHEVGQNGKITTYRESRIGEKKKAIRPRKLKIIKNNTK